jgi:hypothetical protein
MNLAGPKEKLQIKVLKPEKYIMSNYSGALTTTEIFQSASNLKANSKDPVET